MAPFPPVAKIKLHGVKTCPKSHYKNFFTNELFGFQLTRPRYCVTFLSQNVFNPIDTWWTETSKICEELINEYLTYFKMKIFQELSWVHVKFGFFVSGQKCGFGVIMARRPLRHFAAFEGHCPLRNNHPKSNPWKIPELMNFWEIPEGENTNYDFQSFKHCCLIMLQNEKTFHYFSNMTLNKGGIDSSEG